MKRKVKVKKLSNFPVRLNAAERPVLRGISRRLGLIYKGKDSVGQNLHYQASGEAMLLLNPFDTSGEMHAAAKHIRTLLESMNVDNYDALEQPLSGLAAALDAAADIRAEFEQAEHDEIANDYKDS